MYSSFCSAQLPPSICVGLSSACLYSTLWLSYSLSIKDLASAHLRKLSSPGHDVGAGRYALGTTETTFANRLLKMYPRRDSTRLTYYSHYMQTSKVSSLDFYILCRHSTLWTFFWFVACGLSCHIHRSPKLVKKLFSLLYLVISPIKSNLATNTCESHNLEFNVVNSQKTEKFRLSKTECVKSTWFNLWAIAWSFLI